MLSNNRFLSLSRMLPVLLFLAMLTACASFSPKARDYADNSEQSRKLASVYDAPRKYQITLQDEDKTSSVSAPASAGTAKEIKGLGHEEKKKRRIEELKLVEGKDSTTYSDDASSQGERFSVSIQLEEAPLKDLLDVLIVDFLESSYVIEAKPGQKFSINIQGSFSKEDILATLRTTLESMNLTLVSRDSIYHVVPNNVGRTMEGMRFVVHSPKYVKAENLMAVIKDLISGGGKLTTIQGSNILLVLDYPENIRRAMAIIDAFDVPFFSDRYVRIYTLANANAKDVAEEMKKLCNEYGLFVIKDPDHVRVIPVERLNKVVTIASSKLTLEYFDSWIEILDQEDMATTGDKIFTYKPTYCTAADLVKLLDSVFPKPDKDQKNGLTASYDEKSNLLVIKAEKSTYYKALEIITGMDKSPAQVYIQAVIAEIRLDKNMSMGFQWFFKHRFGSGLEHLGHLEIGGNMGNTSASASALKISLTANDFYGFLDLMAQDQEAKIIATPHILVKDGEEASIEIKSEVPVIKSFLSTDVSQGGDTASQPSIEYKDAGIILKVHPRIVSIDELELKVEEEVSDPKAVYIVGDLKSYEFSTRAMSTKLLLKDQESIMIGGLIKDNLTDTNTFIPYLNQIPILKYMFKTDESQREKSELVLFLTPVIVNDPDQLEEFTSRMAALFSNKSFNEPTTFDSQK